MPSLWHLGLLLSFLYDDSACLDEECVLGIVGHPVALPCLSDGLRPDSGHSNNASAGNVSVEWRTDEDEVVFRWVWVQEDAASHTGGTWSVEPDATNATRVSADAPTTGNFTLELSSVPDPKESRTNYSLFVLVSGEEPRPALCSVCLVTAASFSSPLLQREEPEEGGTGEETHFLCQSSGGFPAPSVQWLINDTQEPPEGSVVSTHRTPLRPGSPLYNVTSRLAVALVSPDTRVSCVIHNLSMNQTLTTSTSDGDQVRHVPRRAAEDMWIFSLGLCVAVGAMVLAAIAYQVHLDRNNYKHYPACKADYHLGDDCDMADKMRHPHKHEHQDKERRVTIDLEQVDSLIETDV